MSLTDTEKTKLNELCNKKYKDQAIWFLNAYWIEGGETEAEKVWDYCNKFGEFDPENHAEGCSLDELNIHRILEFYSMHKTIQEFRESLRSAQSAEMQKAQEMVDKVSALLSEAVKKADEATKRDKELEAALKELKKQEDDFNNTTETLKKTVEKETGVVKKNRAQNELAQHLASDPLPLRKAKTTTEAAKRKSEKARAEADAAADEMKEKMREAEEYLNQQKAAASAGQGVMWWMSRELEEKKKYMPKRKGGVDKK
ncbi:Calcium-regulated actin-bundling protein C-terminal domain-containing protein [Entamoeba marina]